MHGIRSRHRRGNILAMAMAFIFVLITIVIAMHTSQSRAVRTVTQAEAEIQFRQSAEFQKVDLMFGGSTPPGTLRVEADPDLVGDLGMPPEYAKTLWTGLPDWNPKEGQEYAPGHRTYKLTPDTSDSALDVFSGNVEWLAFHDSGGYAAYAPNGKIELREAVGWANPTFLDKRPSDEAFSGVPFNIAGKGGVTIERMLYGNAYSEDGPIDLGDDKKDLVIGYQGPLPLRHYEKDLKTSLQAARDQLASAASYGDKTHEIKGDVFDGVKGVFSMLKDGDTSKMSISLEQAMSFPFPTIPSFSITVPGLFFEFWFHVPYAPDLRKFDNGENIADESQSTANDISDKQKEIDKVQAEIKELDAKIAAETDQDTKEDLIKDRDKLKKDLEDLTEEMEDLTKSQEDLAKDSEDQIKGQMEDEKTPKTRAEDEKMTKKGMIGWNYSKLLKNMLSILFNTISGDIDGLMDDLMAEVRLVHFGGKDRVPNFLFDDGFYAEASWTVPRGRSFKFDGKMTLAGDLWLQKGSVMHVTGDLILINPDTSSSSPLKACGKIVMEEGASLLVDGDLKLAGDPRFGSLWVCTPPRHLAPVTTAILVKGTCTIPYGYFSASNLEDAARALGSDGLGDALESLFTDIAPNLSKVVGAFHERKPYFASYATTFQLTIIPPTAFNPPIPIPTPIPLPKENLLVPIFRVLTQVFAPAMNASLGENTYMHADWWAFGEGTIPAMIKLDPAGPMNALKSINLAGLKPDIDWGEYLDELVTTALKEAATFAIKVVAKKIVTTLTASIAPGGGIISELLNQVLGMIDSKETAFEKFRETVMDAALGPILDEFTNFKEKLADEIEDALKESYLREIGGPLIYADTINVGDEADPPRLMAGMLVSENTLNINTQTFVGSLTSFSGNIKARDAYFTPVFTRASLYKPKETGTNTFARVIQFGYGKHFDSGQAVDVTTGVWQVTTEGWKR